MLVVEQPLIMCVPMIIEFHSPKYALRIRLTTPYDALITSYLCTGL